MKKYFFLLPILLFIMTLWVVVPAHAEISDEEPRSTFDY